MLNMFRRLVMRAKRLFKRIYKGPRNPKISLTGLNDIYLWDDNLHSGLEVTDLIMKTMGWSYERAYDLALLTSTHGGGFVAKANLEECQRIAAAFETIGLDSMIQKEGMFFIKY